MNSNIEGYSLVSKVFVKFFEIEFFQELLGSGVIILQNRRLHP